MGFILSGSIITQSGIDTDLSGLSAITGVTTTNVGTIYTMYDIGNNQLTVNGDLTLDANKELLLINSVAPRPCLDIVGSFTMNNEILKNGYTNFQKKIGVIISYFRDACCDNYGLEVQGNFTMNGSTLICNSSINFTSLSTISLINSRIELGRNATNASQLRQYSNNLTAQNFELVNYSMTMIGIPILLKGYKPIHCYEGIGMSGSSSSSEYTFEDYNGKGNGIDFALWGGKKMKIINCDTGTDVIIKNHIDGNVDSYGTVSIYKKINSNIFDNSGKVANCKIYIKDYDNGFRKDGNGYIFTTDRIYEIVTDINGEIIATEILTGDVNEPLYTTDNIIMDRRSKYNDFDDIFDVKYASYLHNFLFEEASFEGLETKIISKLLFIDINITQTDKSIVDNYVDIPDLDKLYDFYKKVIYDDLSISFDLITISGKTINIKDGWKLVRDQTLTNALEFDLVNKYIKIKTSIDGLQRTDKFNSFSGTVDSSMDGHTNVLYVLENGNVPFIVNNLNPENFTLTTEYPASVLYRVEGSANPWSLASTINGNLMIEFLPDTNYEISFRVAGYYWKDEIIDTGNYGIEISADIEGIKDLSENYLFEQTGDPSEMAAITYNSTTRVISLFNETGVIQHISFISAYIRFEQIIHDESIITLIDDKLEINPEINGFIIPFTNPSEIFMAISSNANIMLDFSVKHSDLITDAIDRFHGNSGGFQISTAIEINNLSIPYPSAQENADATTIEIEASTVIAKEATIDNVQTSVDALPTAQDNANLTKTEIEGSTIIAKNSDVLDVKAVSDDIKLKVDTQPTLTEIEASTVIAKDSNVLDVKTVSDDIKVDTTDIKSRVDNLPQG